MTDKTCTNCNKTKPLNEFDRLLRSKDGRQPWCKQCRSEYRQNNRNKKASYDRARYEANADEMRARSKTNRESNPDYLTNYNRAYYQEHAQEIGQAVRQWREGNPEKRRAISLKHKAAKRNADGKFTDRDIRAMMTAQGGRCVYCRRDIRDSYSIDHVIPLSRGGSNWPDNLQLLCSSCNSSKKDKTHEEYLAYLRLTS